jgi:hypothetical protein
MKRKKIILRPLSYNTELTTPAPTPARTEIPKWYKDIPKYVNNGFADGIKNPFKTKTVKPCIPFLDSITSGYLLKLPYDIFCTFDAHGNRAITWGDGNFETISRHSMEQIGKYPIPVGYEQDIFKFNTTWGIQTPKGFSSLYMHPLGGFDLPFYSLHGIVDSDVFWKNINIAFTLKKDFEGVIPQGTTIAQVIPIKRESWYSEVKKWNEDGYDPQLENLRLGTMASGWYKNNSWTKKEYD